MPPKKAAGAAKSDTPAVDGDGNQKFSWTLENERHLLLLCLAHANIGSNEYREFLKAMPAGANYEGIRQRVGKLKREQKSIYEEHGLSPSTDTNAKGKKRTAAAAAITNDEDDAVENPAVEKPAAAASKKKDTGAAPPAKKPRATKKTKSAKQKQAVVATDEVDAEDEESAVKGFTSVNGDGAAIKQEEDDEEEVEQGDFV